MAVICHAKVMQKPL